ncbi:methyl-accepting chemotaxis protein, partial [Acinetobacter pittii]|uniref:methyl-accepting chemotaxis protein n=1 Tax=Acinetobacter pittii TaxID=48296 RepID=UPI0025A5A554
MIEGLDKIAFQTRVLAMNAAVEAGRAGEAGRGRLPPRRALPGRRPGRRRPRAAHRHPGR